jgi:hypothetical protein
MQTNAKYLGLLILAASLASPLLGADDGIRLRETFPEGYQYQVNCRVEVTGSLTLPPEKEKQAAKQLPIRGTSLIDYDERVLSTKAGQVDKTLRLYRQVDFQRKIGDRPQEATIRPEVRRLVVLRLNQVEVPFSPDGPLLWGEIDLVRTDVFTPALTGLLPEGPVRERDRWKAANSAIQELTDMERIEEGQVECRLDPIANFQNRRQARVNFRGSVRGLNEDGPNRQQLDGYFYFDLESNHISYLSLNGVSILLDKDGKEVGRVEGQFKLSRQANSRCRELSDEVVRTLKLEPTEDNTRLLYDNPDLGIRFLYPRRWKVMGVRGRQVAVDETNGNGLLLTVEPVGQVPNGGQYLGESKDWLEQQKARILAVDSPRRLSSDRGELEHFSLEVQLPAPSPLPGAQGQSSGRSRGGDRAGEGGQKVLMDYYVTRQTLGGATMAARLLPQDAPNLRKDVESIARSIAILRTVTTDERGRKGGTP